MTDNKKPAVFIETYGCQMNKYDSELVAGLLKDRGFAVVDQERDADLVLLNTCSVREHAEKRALGRIGVLSGWKKSAPGRKLGVIGCMGQRLGTSLIEKKPFVDLVVGPDEYRCLPDLIENGRPGSCARVALHAEEVYQGVRPVRQRGVTGWIAVSRGCDNHCTYCIVPFTRGSERSRSARDIENELKTMAEQGYRDVTLLGQNVNSYRDGDTDFADLLRRAARVDGILRIRFMTSHPKDLSERLLDALAEGGTLCPHIHLPVQSGSNRILEAMHRGYTRDHILAVIEKARKRIPGVALTTDVMVGFPGETEGDFADTCRLIEGVRFQEAFTYAYSHRPGTPAALFRERLSREEKGERLDRLIRLQQRIVLEIKQATLGTVADVLPESPSRRSEQEWMGRTPSGHVVVFPKAACRPGVPLKIRIEAVKGTTLWGRPEPVDILGTNA